MKRINPTFSEGQDGLVSGKVLADLRGMIWQKVGPAGDFAELAEEAGVAKSTIMNFMFMSAKGHQTKRPHFETIVRLLRALERADLLQAVFMGDHKKMPAGRKKPAKKKQ